MNTNALYPESFFREIQQGAKDSAEAIVPLLIELINPDSVVDVGCGSGTWLSVFQEYGISDILGLDGDHVPRHILQIPTDRFTPFDLTESFQVDRRFDLVISLEVAEHLPESASRTFVESLVRLGDIIVFSAAIPYQEGETHINTQWPSYWIKIFRDMGYDANDCIRDKIWSNEKVNWWYAQNIFMFARKSHLKANPDLKKRLIPGLFRTSVVHPEHYLHVKWKQRALSAALDIVDEVPYGGTFIIVDENKLAHDFGPKRHAVRLPEHEEWYWNPLVSNTSAIQSVQRLAEEGASHLVIAWPAYPWLEQRPGLQEYLKSCCTSLLDTDRVKIFDLQNLPG